MIYVLLVILWEGRINKIKLIGGRDSKKVENPLIYSMQYLTLDTAREFEFFRFSRDV